MNLRTISALSFGACVLTSALLGGCETVSQDIALLTDALTMPSPTEAATMMLDPYNPDHRREGTVLIANSYFGGEPQYVQFYIQSVQQENDPTVLAVAISALARHGTEQHAALIAQHLTHPNTQVRWEAAKGLQRLHDPQVVPGLLNVLRDQDEDPHVRVAAARALGQYPQDRVFQALVAALDSRHLAINLAAEHSLETLTGLSLGLDSRQWSLWYRDQSPQDRFAHRQDYYFPTYSRRLTMFERMMFWQPKSFEQPAIPVGLGSIETRRTYQDSQQLQ